LLIRVGTRGSKLAVLQTNYLINNLKDKCGAEFEIVKIKTSGDITDPRSSQRIGSGIFEKEVDEALLRGDIDLAVHSMKDVPTSIDENLVLAAVPQRLPPNDVFVSYDYVSIESLPKGGVIGTSSLRRAAQVKAKRQDLQIVNLRGNVDTRLRRLNEGLFHGIVLAEAALVRMGMTDVIKERFSTETVPTSPGQGALAIITRRDDREMISLVSKINSPEAMEEVIAERAFLRTLQCGCSSPVGCTATVEGALLKLSCGLYSQDGVKFKLFKFKFPRGSPEECGAEAAQKVINDQDVTNFWRVGR
jgi:hydroxymethylbilane synthase